MNTHTHTTAAGTLVVTIGPAGAGKTTWRQAHADTDTVVVSLDELRARFSSCGCSGDPRANRRATRHGLARTRTALADGRTVVWDVTAYKPAFRQRMLRTAAAYGAHTVGVVFLPPLWVALARNAGRDGRVCSDCETSRRVPADVVTAMHAAITDDLPRLVGEGWHTLHLHHPATLGEVA